jgi:hypothetical protein
MRFFAVLTTTTVPMRSSVASVILMAFVVAVSSAAARGEAGDAQAFRVTSTLDGKKVLPHRIHWLGRPNLPASKVSEVRFLIDGKTRWIEHNPPYTYGDDGNWLVTSWLSPGRHRFTVRARTKAGRMAKRTTIARVLPAPAPPAELAGTWKRSAVGTWVVTIDRAGWKIRDPFGTGSFVDVAYLSRTRLQARGGIWTRPNSKREGNGWCEDTNTPVNYRWAVSTNTLTLELDGRDGCGEQWAKQHFLWAGAWTKVE